MKGVLYDIYEPHTPYLATIKAEVTATHLPSGHSCQVNGFEPPAQLKAKALEGLRKILLDKGEPFWE